MTASAPDSEEKSNELRMVIYPNPLLRMKAVPFTDEQIKSQLCKDIAEQMKVLMYKYNGVGLAAQQAGIPNSICVIDANHVVTGEQNPLVLINPMICSRHEPAIEVQSPGEGCLSLPYGYRQPIPRYSKVEVAYKDLDAQPITKVFEGMEAIVVQHEIEHLNGYLFIDHLSPLKRDMFERKVKKLRRQYLKGTKIFQRQLALKVREAKRIEKAQMRATAIADAANLRAYKKAQNEDFSS